MSDAHLELHEDIVASIVLDGDLSKLSPGQLVSYYYHRCDLLKIDPGEKPFDLLRLNGKLILYCTKAGAAALTRVNQISVHLVDRDMLNELCVHTARATLPCGRSVDDVGAVDLKGLAGEKLANAIMKSATKAKRRAVLGLCGQGLVDESELSGITGKVERVSFADVEAQAKALPAAPETTVYTDIRMLRVALSTAADKPVAEVWAAICKRAGIEPCVVEDVADDAAQWMRAELQKWLDRAKADLDGADVERARIEAQVDARQPDSMNRSDG